MVLNAAVQMLREADELKQKILKFKSGTSMLQERGLWATQQQLQKVYQKVLILDLDYALDKKVEQDLWNIGFKQQIEALQAISKDRKNPLRSEGQAMLSWVLQAAAGFYLCLLHQICTTYKLDLPFRRRASLLGWVEGWGCAAGGGGAGGAAARYISQHCLVHLGDLARYRHQLRVAHTFYRHALVVSAHSGQPYNQLALVSWRRGRRLGALYWHVRSLLVRAPFPPAPNNLARTLQAAAAAANTAPTRVSSELPVLSGVPPPAPAASPARPAAATLDAHSYVTELIRAMHFIHTVEQLDTAAAIVDNLNSSLTALVATDSFESMTLIKMAVVLMWLVHSCTEGLPTDAAALSESESVCAALADSLAAGALLALLLPAYTLPAPPSAALPAVKVWLQWLTCNVGVLSSPAWVSRPQLWPALAHTLNQLPNNQRDRDKYATVPLSEDEELHGFVPLEPALEGLRFPDSALFNNNPQQDDEHNESISDMSSTCLSNEPEISARVRAARLVRLGERLAHMCPERLEYTEEDNKVTFTAKAGGAEQLSAALAELAAAGVRAGRGEGAAAVRAGRDDEGDSDDEPAPHTQPVVISEADFREKVREKRVGILKPQGSLERAREERALASTQEDVSPFTLFEIEACEELKGEDKKESSRKPRVNIAMAAIMRKQEETNKQVKFVTPPPTPDSTTDTTGENKDQDNKPKIIQPKVMKSLANLPIGRKTGGILSLKDKSAGYPHLVNTDPEPKKEDEKKKEIKPNLGSSQNSQQNYQKRSDHPTSPNWSGNQPPNFEGPRMNFPKTYGIQNPGLNYPSYPQSVNNQGIRLPVVNPKEIDVRTAALQKQNSRQELFQDGHKFGNHKYPVSGDKKNFLNDLPPRFANQYRYWQTAQENQFNDNKFRDENFQNNSLFNSQRPGWMNTTQMPDNFQQPTPWWKPENPPPNFNANYSAPMNLQPNFYSPHLGTNIATPYPNMSTFNQMPNQNQDKPQNLITPPNYIQTAIGQPQMPTLQNLVSSQNFNSSLNNFGSYAPAVGYDSSMYPQFNNKLGYQPLQMKMMDKPQSYQGKDLMDIGGLGFGANMLDLQQRNLNMNFNDPMNNDVGGAKNLDQVGTGSGPASSASGTGVTGAGAANTYSLFSGAPDSAWGANTRQPHQSLWSGPGPSPLERLLEQQKQMKQPPPPQ